MRNSIAIQILYFPDCPIYKELEKLVKEVAQELGIKADLELVNYNVENALKDTPGVVNVTVGFVGKEIINGTVEGRGEVVYDTTKTNPDKMLQAILPYKGAVVNDEVTSSTELASFSKTFGL